VFPVPIPKGAVALVGWTVNATAAGVINYWATHINIQDLSGANATTAGGFAGARGTKSAWGSVPIEPTTQQIQADVLAIEAITYTAVAYFLIAPGGTVITSVPLTPTGSGDVVVAVTTTSATNTAQALVIPGVAQQDMACELLAAWFYNSGAGTATGTLQFTDGTTPVTIDTTAAVASYVFNLSAKGSRQTAVQTGFGFIPQIRFAIGAGGVGITTTLIFVYRIYPIR
jgi:hypothetical protein